MELAIKYHVVLVFFFQHFLSQLLFNPLTSNLNRYLIRSEDIDPDAHVNIESRCDYYVEDKFNEALQSQLVSENYFSIFHLNVRSLQNKLDDLTALLANLDVKFSIVGITETWLQNSAYNADINGYDFVFKIAHSNRAGVLDCTCQMILTLKSAKT